MRRLPILLALVALVGSAPLLRYYSAKRLPKPFVQKSELFALPTRRAEIFRLNLMMQKAIQQKDLRTCRQLAERMTVVDPSDPMAWYSLSSLLAVTQQSDRAMDTLTLAVANGFRDVSRIKSDPALRLLQQNTRMPALLKKAAMPWKPNVTRGQRQATPADRQITNHQAIVNDQNTRWNEQELSLITEFEVPTSETELSPSNVLRLGSTAASRVRNWIQEKSAAGFSGLLYDNRDRDHSTLNPQLYPSLTFVEYAPAVQAAQADYGLRPGQRFNLPTFGNSSTSYVAPPFWRSNARMLLSDEIYSRLTASHYLKNQLYCYPEHNDFDPQYGDVFPVNAPFWVLSQGSSGSDQPFLSAIALTLAAFRSDVRQRLESDGLLMHAVQFILRRSLRFVQSDADYYTGRAHPVVFQSQDLDVDRMVQMAHDMTLSTIPPVVRLAVLEEDTAVPGIDYFAAAEGETLLTTPLAIGRVFRTLRQSRRMVLDASESSESLGRPLQFRWVVLQGDPGKIHIRPLNASGSRAEVVVDWHDRFDIPWLKGMSSSRVDIGVFASSPESTSLPGMLCSLFIASEKREYHDGRLISVDYASEDYRNRYTDPLIAPIRNWKDVYTWSDAGQLAGWIRYPLGQAPVQFDSAGRMQVTDQNSQSRFVPVQYYPETNTSGVPELRFAPSSGTR
jgi:hypothetical protein